MLDNPLIKVKRPAPGEVFWKKEEILSDFWISCISREASLLARRDVLNGRGKFAITGDGKEIPQIAIARAFQKGDYRSGYYRDQTMMLYLGLTTIEDYFAQLYADPVNDPFSGGRQMNNHFATPFVDKDGNWTVHRERYNISSGISSTGGQMARGIGLAFASKKYRESEVLRDSTPFSNNGNEVCFLTIGDASTTEGVFWETINAAGVLQIPLAVFVYDDGYGISVPIEYQTTKGSISEALRGFQAEPGSPGIDIYTVKGWDYPSLRQTIEEGVAKLRETFVPAVFHIQELTQPQGHSTSGSHERYKSKERLDWEREYDCNRRFEKWILSNRFASLEELQEIKKKAANFARDARDKAWKSYNDPNQRRTRTLLGIYQQLAVDCPNPEANRLHQQLRQSRNPLLYELLQSARRMRHALIGAELRHLAGLCTWLDEVQAKGQENYHTNLYSHSDKAALKVRAVPAAYAHDAPLKNGFEILNAYFDQLIARDPRVFAFGEDVGKIGDVNQGFAGLQEKHGEDRIFDTGIREWTIVGQAMGMAMRGLRPIAEIQYLDYLIFGLEPLTDDVATLRYRTDGLQQAPIIIRTRGHRLEGIWHSGSPLGMIINSLRGMYVLVPRNMTQAAGFYNTMLQSDDPAIIIECLNGYRLKESLPSNLDTFTVPLGIPETLEEGTDLTLVTYGSCVRVAQEGIRMLRQHGISVELIDVQTLLPFDIESRILASLRKTNRLLVMDEDVPGGATAFMLQQILEVQGGYQYLDSAPATLTAKDHRPPYGSDGDYFTKPNPEDVFETVYRIMHESEPDRFPGGL